MNRPLLWFATASALSTVLYLLASRFLGYTGFPLDDAWIHQTYARNLVEHGQWAFVPGHPSAGSTSPLWTLALALGYALRIEYHLWTYLCGWAALVAVAYLTYRLALGLHGHATLALFTGLFVALEWHLAWAAASGMETLLFTALALWVLQSPIPNYQLPLTALRALIAGMVLAAAVFVRPDGLSLVPFAALGLLLAPHANPRRAITQFGFWALGFGIPFSGYLAFNYALSGSIWPNTFYAKQAEYAILRELPLLTRLGRVFAAPFVGGLAVLLPGLALSILRNSQLASRNPPTAPRLLPLAWAISFLALYAMRLPVTYQHARYLMPVIPVLAIYGFDGMAAWFETSARRPLPPDRPPPLVTRHLSHVTRRILRRTLAISLAVTTLAFWLISANAYGQDVRIIETEMVATARWLNANTPPGARIAVHDIGAVGYFTRREIFDLAGLISPQVIPFIRDEATLADWIVASRADYLVTFPGWYPRLAADARFDRVFSTSAPYSPAAGGENMTVYRVVDRLRPSPLRAILPPTIRNAGWLRSLCSEGVG